MHSHHNVAFFGPRKVRAQYWNGQKDGENGKGKKSGENRKGERGERGH